MSIQNILATAMAAKVSQESETEEVVLDEVLMSLDQSEDMVDAELELSEVEGALEITENTEVALESLAEAVIASQENGGLDAQSAALLNVATAAIMAPFGGQTSSPMPGMESYEGDGGRATATQVALEGIKETLANMWETIMRLVTKAVEAIKKFFTANFTQLGRIEKAAKGLGDKAGKSKGVPKEKELEFKNAAALKSGSKDDAGLNPSTIAGLEKSMAGSFGGLVSLTDNILSVKATDYDGMKVAVKKANKDAAGTKFNDIPAAYEIEVDAPKGDDDNGTKLFSLKVKEVKDAKGKLKALDASTIASLCGAIEKAAPAMAKTAKAMDKVVSDLKKEMDKNGSELLKEARTKTDADSSEAVSIKRAMSMSNKAFGLGRQLAAYQVKYGVKVLAASLQFAKASYDNLEVKA
jgi:hypothetical protein